MRVISFLLRARPSGDVVRVGFNQSYFLAIWLLLLSCFVSLSLSFSVFSFPFSFIFFLFLTFSLSLSFSSSSSSSFSPCLSDSNFKNISLYFHAFLSLPIIFLPRISHVSHSCLRYSANWGYSSLFVPDQQPPHTSFAVISWTASSPEGVLHRPGEQTHKNMRTHTNKKTFA